MTRPEAWLRGPVPGVPELLQPVAHALVQAREEVEASLVDYPSTLLWTRPRGVAAVGFHLRHLTGVLDRLFTYARGEVLDEQQRAYLAAESTAPVVDATAPAADGAAARAADDAAAAAADSARALIAAFDAQVERALEQLRATDPASLTDSRFVGRARLPSTVLGLLFHAAEHTQRHVGQLLVTARVQRSG